MTTRRLAQIVCGLAAVMAGSIGLAADAVRPTPPAAAAPSMPTLRTMAAGNSRARESWIPAATSGIPRMTMTATPR